MGHAVGELVRTLQLKYTITSVLATYKYRKTSYHKQLFLNYFIKPVGVFLFGHSIFSSDFLLYVLYGWFWLKLGQTMGVFDLHLLDTYSWKSEVLENLFTFFYIMWESTFTSNWFLLTFNSLFSCSRRNKNKYFCQTRSGKSSRWIHTLIPPYLYAHLPCLKPHLFLQVDIPGLRHL
jgi:hypothetical protein